MRRCADTMASKGYKRSSSAGPELSARHNCNSGPLFARRNSAPLSAQGNSDSSPALSQDNSDSASLSARGNSDSAQENGKTRVLYIRGKRQTRLGVAACSSLIDIFSLVFDKATPPYGEVMDEHTIAMELKGTLLGDSLRGVGTGTLLWDGLCGVGKILALLIKILVIFVSASPISAESLAGR